MNFFRFCFRNDIDGNVISETRIETFPICKKNFYITFKINNTLFSN